MDLEWNSRPVHINCSVTNNTVYPVPVTHCTTDQMTAIVIRNEYY